MSRLRNAARWGLRLAAAVVALWTLVFAFPACNTPFIPIPPPADPTFAPVVTADGMGGTKTVWEARGGPQSSMAQAKVYVFNLDGGSGVIVRADADGSYVAGPLDGRMGDRIQLKYETPKGEASPEICRELGAGLARTECRR